MEDRVIRAVQEAIWPSTADHESSGADQVFGGVPAQVVQVMNKQLYGPCQDQLRILLWAMSHRLPMLLLAGQHSLSCSWPFLLTFPEMSLRQRQATLYSWRGSNLALLKRGYKALKALVASALLSYVDPVTGSNPILNALGYCPGTAVSEASAGPPPPTAAEAEEVLASAVVHMPDVAGGPVDAQAYLTKRGFQTGAVPAAGPPSSVPATKLPCGQHTLELHYDAVVVGSGAGGGVTAALLASAGMKVLVLEKSGWVRRRDMSWLEGPSHTDMYERGGFMVSDDASVTLLAGSTLGGGTKINWTASLKTPPHVRQEWAAAPHSLPQFTSSDFDTALDVVCSRMGVHTDTKMSTPNRLLLQGLQALGLHGEELPRNCLSKTCHAYCNMGCRSGHKQSSDVCWLVDAVRAGAHILTGVEGKRVLTAPAKDGLKSKKVVAITAQVSGVTGSVPLLQLLVHTPLVVASCGSLHNPALLLRSGITVNGNVGRHLRIHPAVGVVGQFRPTTAGQGAVRMHEGVSMGAFSRAAAAWSGDGYGAMVSVPAVHPALLAAICPDLTPGAMKADMLQLQDTSTCVIFTRDSSSGQVKIDSSGRPVVSYWPCQVTVQHLIDGIELSCKALLAAGAVRLMVPHAAEEWILELDPSQPLETRLAQLDELVQHMRQTGIKKYDMPVFSAHQMGSCRMGSSPKSSVCDSKGECWEVSGLYVADASTFPSASGVNPMITVYGISYLVASGIAATWKAAAKKSN